MITSWMVYGIGILDGVKGFFICAAIIAAVISIVIGLVTIEEENEEKKKKKIALFVKGVLALVLSLLLFSISPSSQLAASMYVIPAIANNEKLQNIGENTLNGLEKLTEQWLQELSEGDKKNQSGDKI